MDKRVKNIFLIFILVMFSLTSVFAFSDLLPNPFNYFFNEDVSLDPGDVRLTDIQTNSLYTLRMGYSHNFSGGRVVLFDNSGEGYLSADGINFRNFDKTTAGLPSNFKPTVGYYHPFSGGRVVLWDQTGKAYIFNSANNLFKLIDRTQISGLPSTFVPIIGYYHNFGGGGAVLWGRDVDVLNGANIKVYTGDSTGTFRDTSNFITDNNLPAGKSPLTIYYYDFPNKKGIHIWYYSNGVKLYNYDGTSVQEISLTNIGLPLDSSTSSTFPTFGYFDSIRNKIVLVYGGNKIYESSDGSNFVQSGIVDSCTKDLRRCPDGSLVGRDYNNNCEFLQCPVVQQLCTDSDGGKQYHLKGNTIGYLMADGTTGNPIGQLSVDDETNSPPFNQADSCVKLNGGTVGVPVAECSGSDCFVNEYYCDNNVIKHETPYKLCPNGCSNGACLLALNSKCFAPSSGNVFIKSYAFSTLNSQSPETKWDTCVDDNYQSVAESNKLMQFSCSGSGEIISSSVICQAGCSDGACNKVTLSCGTGQKIGDANADGIVDSRDVQVFDNIINGNMILPENKCCFDIDKNGVVNANDSQKIIDSQNSANGLNDNINFGVCSDSNQVTCGWCGQECTQFSSSTACLGLQPPIGYDCKNVNGQCTQVLLSGGLPSSFAPVVGYSHNFSGGRVVLFDNSGEGYLSPDGVNFKILNKITAGLPSNFIPTVGYYHPFSGGRILLWDSTGKAYIFNSANNLFKLLDRTQINSLPSTFVPAEGYYHNFGGGRVVLWDSTGKIYTGDSAGTFRDTSNFISSNNLPAGKSPSTIYYYDFPNSRKGIHLWYSSNGVKLYNYDGTSKQEVNLIDTGLPSSLPSTGYFDSIRNKIVLWYGTNRYESDNGLTFVSVSPMGDECATDDDCSSTTINLCSENRACTRSDTYVCISGLCEINVVGTQTCGDTCANGCSNGVCSQGDGGGGGGGGGGSSRFTKCTPHWGNCTWGPCQNNIQNFICTDLNKCGSNIGKPQQTITCLVDSQCIDNDSDGYGNGPDCLGTDANDNDPNIITGDELNQEELQKPFNYIWLIVIALGILIVIAVIIIIFVKNGKISFKPKSPTNNFTETKLKIAEYKKNGYTDDEIKFILKSKGWKDSDLDKLMK